MIWRDSVVQYCSLPRCPAYISMGRLNIFIVAVVERALRHCEFSFTILVGCYGSFDIAKPTHRMFEGILNAHSKVASAQSMAQTQKLSH